MLTQFSSLFSHFIHRESQKSHLRLIKVNRRRHWNCIAKINSSVQITNFFNFKVELSWVKSNLIIIFAVLMWVDHRNIVAFVFVDHRGQHAKIIFHSLIFLYISQICYVSWDKLCRMRKCWKFARNITFGPTQLGHSYAWLIRSYHGVLSTNKQKKLAKFTTDIKTEKSEVFLFISRPSLVLFMKQDQWLHRCFVFFFLLSTLFSLVHMSK